MACTRTQIHLPAPLPKEEKKNSRLSHALLCHQVPAGLWTGAQSLPLKTDSFSPHANLSLGLTCLLCMGLLCCFFRASPFLSFRFLKEPNAWRSALGSEGKHPGRFSVCWKLTHKLDLAVLSLPSALIPTPGAHGSQAWKLTQ